MNMFVLSVQIFCHFNHKQSNLTFTAIIVGVLMFFLFESENQETNALENWLKVKLVDYTKPLKKEHSTSPETVIIQVTPSNQNNQHTACTVFPAAIRPIAK